MTRTTFRVAFFLKRMALKKNGLMPIMARITINNEMAHFSTKLEVEPKQWNTSAAKAIGTSEESKRINQVLETIKFQLTDIYNSEHARGAVPTSAIVKNIFFGLDSSQDTLLRLFEKNNDDIKRLIGISATLVTYKKYELAKRRLSEFLRYKYQIDDIRPKELTPDFVREYEIFLRANCNLSHNVAAKMILFLKRIVSIAFNSGLIPTNPFSTYRIKLEKVDRGYLTKEELSVMMTKPIDIKRLDYVRDVFLFCCWTGLSYIDVRNLKRSNLRKTDSGELWISTKRKKTGSNVEVLLLDVPCRIIAKYESIIVDGDNVLPVLSNQKCNSYLKELADICLINKNLTFHMSRHTFATTITLSNGVPIETVSRMLGHSNIKITQIYARITNDKIQNDMSMLASKLDNFGTSYRG
ncbi:MAG: site-specific integrase [Rikenellaceae bacterium]